LPEQPFLRLTKMGERASLAAEVGPMSRLLVMYTPTVFEALIQMKNKIKTRKTVVKRFTKTGTGKLMRNKTGLNHLMRKKDGNRKRNLVNDGELYKGDKKRIKRMLGTGL
jgi:large subunit ribosomal protein L35